jgi:cytoskeletal protein RodZ
LPLLIVVALLLIAGVIWRARSTRRLTIEESVDRYRRTLTAVHNAATSSGEGERAGGGSTAVPSHRGRAPGSRRRLILAAMAAATLAVIAVVIAGTRGKPSARAATTTTTEKPRPPRSTTSTTAAAPTTTTPLVVPSGTTGSEFRVSKPTYIVSVKTTGLCWIDMRDAAGAILFDGTLAAGGSHEITAGDVTVKLGNPAAVTLTINGTPVPISLTNGSPASLHFTGSAA